MRAIELQCPRCGTRPGEYCGSEGIGTDLHQERINAAVQVTKKANQELRRASKQGDK